MTLKRMLAEMDSRELSAWRAFDLLEPIDHARRAELSSGILAALIHNSHCTKQHQCKPASHFMQQWGEIYREQHETPGEPMDVGDKLDGWMRYLGGHH